MRRHYVPHLRTVQEMRARQRQGSRQRLLDLGIGGSEAQAPEVAPQTSLEGTEDRTVRP